MLNSVWGRGHQWQSLVKTLNLVERSPLLLSLQIKINSINPWGGGPWSAAGGDKGGTSWKHFHKTSAFLNAFGTILAPHFLILHLFWRGSQRWRPQTFLLVCEHFRHPFHWALVCPHISTQWDKHTISPLKRILMRYSTFSTFLCKVVFFLDIRNLHPWGGALLDSHILIWRLALGSSSPITWERDTAGKRKWMDGWMETCFHTWNGWNV